MPLLGKDDKMIFKEQTPEFKQKYLEAQSMIHKDHVLYFEENVMKINQTFEDEMSIFGCALAFGSYPLIINLIENYAEQLKKPYVESDGYHPIYYVIGRDDLSLQEKKRILTFLKDEVGERFLNFDDTIQSFANLCYAHQEQELSEFLDDLLS